MMAGKIIERGVRSFAGSANKNLLMRVLGSNSSQQPTLQRQAHAWRKVPGVTEAYFRLPQPDNKITCCYVWIDGTGVDVRRKTMTLPKEPSCVEEVPQWCFDGAQTYLAEGHVNTQLKLQPVKMINDPFRRWKNKVVLCEVLNHDNCPHEKNYRAKCLDTMEKARDREPWFGWEQQYTFLDTDGWPLKWPKPAGFPAKEGPFFCSVGAGKAVARDIIESHYRACMYSGLEIGGINLEVMPGQAEFQLGPVLGTDAADQLWLSRYILHRVAEDYGVVVSFDPKPVKGPWNGAGVHANFSTKRMRCQGGDKIIMQAIEKLGAKHKEHVVVYGPREGKDVKRRLTGKHGMSDFNKFTAGVGDRGASVRVPRAVEDQGFGYLEDRRPSANCDPYRVASKLVETCCLDGASNDCGPPPPRQNACPPSKAPSMCPPSGPQPKCPPSTTGGKGGHSGPPKLSECDPCSHYWKKHR